MISYHSVSSEKSRIEDLERDSTEDLVSRIKRYYPHEFSLRVGSGIYKFRFDDEDITREVARASSIGSVIKSTILQTSISNIPNLEQDKYLETVLYNGIYSEAKRLLKKNGQN